MSALLLVRPWHENWHEEFRSDAGGGAFIFNAVTLGGTTKEPYLKATFDPAFQRAWIADMATHISVTGGERRKIKHEIEDNAAAFEENLRTLLGEASSRAR